MLRSIPGILHSEEDLQRQFGRTAVPEEVRRAVQVDVVTPREGRGGARVVPGALELVGPPALYLVELPFLNEFCR